MSDSRPPLPERPLFFLDYDGTLAPIVDDPESAFPHPSIPQLLEQLKELHPVYVISGRDVAALERLLPVSVGVIGLHGSERGTLHEEVRNIALARHGDDFDRMRETVPDVEGVKVEDKSGAFAVHYRKAPDEDRARAALREWARQAPDDLETIWGKKVVELRPRDISKGTAVAELAEKHQDRTPIYLGDDVTDEDAFKALEEEHEDAVTVKVGDGETAARYRLPDVDAVVEYLARYVNGV